ncbi:ATP-dependent Clp protease proteolytic subunit [Proteus penneri]|uniref:ATP-dependent Clp protease proteolytic subunit n=1 Tax=Proteus penneri TaxID=102862 RepID=A0A0G4Q0C5_9GAMM|nr:ATP-dependent Clp protease proteolytic subunit [Proteus penneri]CRL59081.1 hypothetical protein BN1804_00254 [Proteus penneri]
MLNNKNLITMPKMSGPVTQKNWFRMQAKEDQTADIYIYDDIGGWGISARRFTEDLLSLGNLSHINLHIHSPGGEVFDGIAMYSENITIHINKLANNVKTYKNNKRNLPF